MKAICQSAPRSFAHSKFNRSLSLSKKLSFNQETIHPHKQIQCLKNINPPTSIPVPRSNFSLRSPFSIKRFYTCGASLTHSLSSTAPLFDSSHLLLRTGINKYKHIYTTKRLSSCCAPKDEINEEIEKLTIYWGSQTGTAKSFAEDLHHQLSDATLFEKSNLEILDLSEFSPEKLAGKKYVAFITACYGEGEPTDNAKEFFMWLMDEQRDEEKEKFQDLRYTIFGLGSSKAHRERYQVVSRYLHQRLSELSSTCFFPVGEGDDSEDIESDFERWKSELIEFLGKYSTQKNKLSSSDSSSSSSSAETCLPDYAIIYHDYMTSPSPIHTYLPTQDVGANNYFPAKLIDSIEVCPKRSTKQLWLSIKGAKLEYEAGDYLCVYPKNSKEAVEKALYRLNLNPFTRFSLTSSSPSASFPSSLMKFKDRVQTVEDTLTDYIDLQTFVSPMTLRSLASHAGSSTDREQLLLYSQINGRYAEVKKEKMSIVDLLYQFPSINLSWNQFLEIAPSLNPRYYSIASSSHATKNMISIVCRRVVYNTPGGRVIRGLCSHYLTHLTPSLPPHIKSSHPFSAYDYLDNQSVDQLVDNAKDNAEVRVYVKQSSFRLPENKLDPVIMVAGGCGIAPFVGFIKEREYLKTQGHSLGPAYLFFGCRNEQEMMFQGLIHYAVSSHIITDAYLAFSDANPPVLVTDLLIQQKQVVYPLLLQNAHIYMCGADFSTAAYQSFFDIIVQSSNTSPAEAKEFLKKMIFDGRYHEDLQS